MNFLCQIWKSISEREHALQQAYNLSQLMLYWFLIGHGRKMNNLVCFSERAISKVMLHQIMQADTIPKGSFHWPVYLVLLLSLLWKDSFSPCFLQFSQLSPHFRGIIYSMYVIYFHVFLVIMVFSYWFKAQCVILLFLSPISIFTSSPAYTKLNSQCFATSS